MGMRDDILADWEAALAALAWQVDLGVTDVCGDGPVDLYALAETARAPLGASAGPAMVAPRPVADPTKPGTILPRPTANLRPDIGACVAAARVAADGAQTLDGLRAALDAFEHCELRKGARSLVFGAGNPRARVLVLGDAPGREDDMEGQPFAGAAGRLLDAMFAAVGFARGSPDPDAALYLTHAMPWRPPQDREPDEDEIAMLRPFVARHIALVDPDVVVVVGNSGLACLLGTRGISQARGRWAATEDGYAVLPMLSPGALLRHPIAKREAWADLLALKSRLAGAR